MVLSVTSHIHFELRLLGGEPLLNRKAAQMLLYSLKHPKIERVELVTNGTFSLRDLYRRFFPPIPALGEKITPALQ